MDLGLKGKVALVQGASQGLGFAIAQALCKEGASVAIASRSEASLKKAADAMGAKLIVPCDLSQPGAGAQSVKTVIDKLGTIDILVTNTGGPPKGQFVDITEEMWLSGFQTLWLAATQSIQAALPVMQKKKWGRVLLVTSAAAREPMPAINVSNGLRAGLLGLTKSISNEVAAHGVTINALLPGYTRTERLAELGIAEDKITSMIPARRLGEPEELGALAAFLASERAAYISGQAIACDGGYLRGI